MRKRERNSRNLLTDLYLVNSSYKNVPCMSSHAEDFKSCSSQSGKKRLKCFVPLTIVKGYEMFVCVYSLYKDASVGKFQNVNEPLRKLLLRQNYVLKAFK